MGIASPTVRGKGGKSSSPPEDVTPDGPAMREGDEAQVGEVFESTSEEMEEEEAGRAKQNVPFPLLFPFVLFFLAGWGGPGYRTRTWSPVGCCERR